MTSFIAKFFTSKILGESVQNKFGTEDPYFEHVPATRLDGTPTGKLKKRKKALPPGISDKDAKVLTKVKRRAYRLDLSLCNCCGIRFGWSSVIGLVPAIGDVADALMALIVMKTCSQIEGGLPMALKIQMLLNIGFDFLIGLVPFAGDLVDAVFRANTRNAALLEAHLREVGKKNLRKSGQPLPAVDPSDPNEFDREQTTDSPPPGYVGHAPAQQQPMAASHRDEHRNGRHQQMPAEPEPAQVRKGGGWFFGRNKSRRHDEEMGGQPSKQSKPQTKHQSSGRRH